MMIKERLSINQLIFIIISFNLGSSLIIRIGQDAKEDAWLAVFFSSLIGIVISLFIYYLYILYPNKNLYEIIEYCFNKRISLLISTIYLVYFFYHATRIIRDFGEMTNTFILPNTPIEFIILTFSLILGYILYLGIEVFGRVTEIFTPYSFLFLFLLIIFLIIGGNLDVSNIKPILAEGYAPIVRTIFPYELVRPYGQFIAFTCLFTVFPSSKLTTKFIIQAVFLSGVLLTICTLAVTMSLGPELAARSNYPLVSATRLISISDFLQRVDTLAIFILMFGIIVKSAVFIYAGLKGLEYLFNIPYRYFTIPIICVISMYSTFIAIQQVDHITEGASVIPFFLSLPLQLLFPCLLMLVMLKLRGSQ